MSRQDKPTDRKVTGEEKRLWKLVTRHDKPLREAVDQGASDAFDIDSYAREQAVRPVETLPTPVPKSKKPDFTLLRQGDCAGIDKRTAEKFKKGKMPIDVRVDLHGHDQAEAYEALRLAVEKAVAADQRVLLVITGKGRDGEGVLRQSLPYWLNTVSVRPYVLAFEIAARQDGGDGAFYVLLKRNRNQP